MGPEAAALPVLLFLFLNLVLLLAGYRVMQHQNLGAAWLLLGAGLPAVHLLFLEASPVARMFTLIISAFVAMKAIAATASRQAGKQKLKFSQWLAFALAWAGMRPQPFTRLGAPALPRAWPLVWSGLGRVALGLGLVLLARSLARGGGAESWTYWGVSALLLTGFSFILHFGLLAISAGAWRLLGVNVSYLFRAPARSRSLEEFWSRRWNLAFSEMTSVAVFRPLKNKMGTTPALLAAFAFSGLLHELAISLPVQGGYGLPLLYFLIQGVGVALEKRALPAGPAFLAQGLPARLWVSAWLLLPLPLLFPARFIREIIWPLAGL
ncbi:MAG: MBOAT family protein [Adhaeribacter sp.]